MDPNATLRAIEEAIEVGDDGEAALLCSDLRGWLANGGYEPSWDTYGEAKDFYRRQYTY